MNKFIFGVLYILVLSITLISSVNAYRSTLNVTFEDEDGNTVTDVTVIGFECSDNGCSGC